jgi:hypothetical protein
LVRLHEEGFVRVGVRVTLQLQTALFETMKSFFAVFV